MRHRPFGRTRHEAGPDQVGLVRTIEPRTCWSLAIIAADVPMAVQAAGGWLCDRVRAGWRVTAIVPLGSDTTPLQILGVTAECFDTESGPSVLTPMPATLALGADMLAPPSPISADVAALVRSGIEVAVWGEEAFTSSEGFDETRHRLSPAAMAFKSHALRAASLPVSDVPVEFFRTRAPWYSLDDGADLERVGEAASSARARLSNAQ